jgi:hypothetical protein
MAMPAQAEDVTDQLRRRAEVALATHQSEGRLAPEERTERVKLVRRAVHNAEIDAVFADLPRPHPRFTADTGTLLPVLAAFVWVGTVVTAFLGAAQGVWWPLALAAGVFLVVIGTHEVVATGRLADFENSQLEQQRRQQRVDLSNLRLGHDERRSAAEMLIVHAAAGLPLRAYWGIYERLPTVRTRGELRKLLGDLPPPDPAFAPTVLSSEADRHPPGLFVGVTTLVLFPGLPVAIMWWVNHGQWYWMLAWVAAVAVLVRVQVARRKARG